ncbi:hypothetical protein [Pedobacter chitinilyticus]|uniref:hypothetical protein n=1 Tax=Pedobacter chitinilyticus TaxID=2233776 RepID=UPI0013C3F6AF|nr:hypothetical protein [Pedobacter chitinilyticus]
MLLLSIKVSAQTEKATDSLALIRNYLLDIQKAVNTKQPQKHKVAKLDSLIRLATKQQAVFERNLSPVLKNKREVVAMESSLNFILQSMVLYKTGIKNSQSRSAHAETLYLNKNISILANKITYYCKTAK